MANNMNRSAGRPARRGWGVGLALSLVLVGAVPGAPAHAQDSLTSPRVPPDPPPEQIERALPDLGNPVNKPITGAAESPLVVGTAPPPSLEALQAARPGDETGDGIEPGRAAMIRTAALTYGAQGGLAARSFALNEMLRRHESQLDLAYDFSTLVLPVGRGQTLMRPPVVSSAQMAFALGEGGQVARETACVYRITRNAQLASAPPNWRAYLVRTWAAPRRPNDGALPHTRQEVAFWNKWVAEGWAQGEKQAVEIFLSDLGRLERDIVGMARYRVLLRARLVEAPRVVFRNRAVQGGRDLLHVRDKTIRITAQPGLEGDRRRWAPAAGCPQ
jgi:defect in organelle trafficking protein DotC